VQASDAYHVFTSGQNKIQQGLLREGYELISEALNLLNNVYGAMHPGNKRYFLHEITVSMLF
jgi:protein TIF31